MTTHKIVHAWQEDGWDMCLMPDCPNKACLWGGTGFCHPHSVQDVGRPEMDRRYRETRVEWLVDMRWNGKLAPTPPARPGGGG